MCGMGMGWLGSVWNREGCVGMGVLVRVCVDGVPGGKLEDGCVCGVGGGVGGLHSSSCQHAHLPIEWIPLD